MCACVCVCVVGGCGVGVWRKMHNCKLIDKDAIDKEFNNYSQFIFTETYDYDK